MRLDDFNVSSIKTANFFFWVIVGYITSLGYIIVKLIK